MLERMALSIEESKVYLKALERGYVTLKDVAEVIEGGVKEAQALLKAMEARRLVKPHVEGRYEASKPKEAVNLLVKVKVEELNVELERLQEDASKLVSFLEDLYVKKKLGIKPEALLKPLDDLNSMELQTVKMISEAREKVDIFTAGFGWLDRVYEELLNAISRGVKVRVLMKVVDEPSKSSADKLRSIAAEVRVQREPWYPLRGTMVDDRMLVFVIWATEHKTTYYRPHHTENEGLIRVFRESFNKRWEEAEPYS